MVDTGSGSVPDLEGTSSIWAILLLNERGQTGNNHSSSRENNMVYHHILVPIDGSPPSLNALQAGIEMAIEQGSIVTALYVVPKVGQLVQVFAIKDVKDAFYQEGERILDKAREIAKSMNFNLSVRIKEGIPHKIIIETAETLNCDLIVMGNQGRSGPSKLLIGSCTQRVLAGAPCPVLVVRE